MRPIGGWAADDEMRMVGSVPRAAARWREIVSPAEGDPDIADRPGTHIALRRGRLTWMAVSSLPSARSCNQRGGQRLTAGPKAGGSAPPGW